MFVDYLFLLAESVSHYRCLLPYWRGELTFENPNLKMIVYICLVSCAFHYPHEFFEALKQHSGEFFKPHTHQVAGFLK